MVLGASAMLLVGTVTSSASAAVPVTAPPVDVDYGSVITSLQRDIPATMQASGVVGLTIALVDGPRVVWTQGFGSADREAAKPVTTDTLFHIGSLSKTFTAIAVMQLVERGLVDLDAPLSKYVPEFSLLPRFRDSEITVRTVLDHHSGVPGDVFNGLITTGRPDPRFRSWLQAALPAMYQEHKVNTVYAYNNSGYVLLQNLVEKVSGLPFEIYAQRNLFGRMGMTSSTFNDVKTPAARLTRNYAATMSADGTVAEVHREPREFVNGWTAGSITSSARDMAKYVSMLLTRGASKRAIVLNPATLRSMWIPQVDSPLDISFFREGLGFAIGDADLPWAGRVVWHDGATVWNHSMLKLLPDSGLGVFVSVNTEAPGVVSAAVASEALALAYTAKTGVARPASAPLPLSVPVAYSTTAAAADDGLYAGSTSLFKVQATDAGLAVTGNLGTPAEATTVFEPFEDGWYRSESTPTVQFSFRTVEGRHLMLVRTVLGAGPVTVIGSERLRAPTMRDAWQPYLGSYRAVNAVPNVDPSLLSKSIVLRVVDGVLVLALPSELGMQALQPGPNGSMLTAGVGTSLGRGKGDCVIPGKTKAGTPMVTYLGVKYVRVAD